VGALLYDINSEWPGKSEPAQVVGSKFLRTLDALEKIEPAFRDWESSDQLGGSDPYSIKSVRSRISDWVSAHPPSTEESAPWESGVGCWVYAVSHSEPCPGPSRQAVFHVRAGSIFRNDNHFEVGSSFRPPDLALVTFPLYKAALLTMISLWPAPWACARCSIWGEDPPTLPGEPPFPYSGFQMPWIAYLDADRARTANIPSTVATERTPDDGLLMIASQTRFDPTNSEHMRASRLIAQTMIAHAGDT
jgi:hypothetical protein